MQKMTDVGRVALTYIHGAVGALGEEDGWATGTVKDGKERKLQIAAHLFSNVLGL